MTPSRHRRHPGCLHKVCTNLPKDWRSAQAHDKDQIDTPRLCRALGLGPLTASGLCILIEMTQLTHNQVIKGARLENQI